MASKKSLKTGLAILFAPIVFAGVSLWLMPDDETKAKKADYYKAYRDSTTDEHIQLMNKKLGAQLDRVMKE